MDRKRARPSADSSSRPTKSPRISSNPTAPLKPTSSSRLDATHPEHQSFGPVTPLNATPVPLSRPEHLPPLPPLAGGSLSTAPFTHSSVVDAKSAATTHLTYERLEFLGDANLELIATRLIYSRYPHLLTGKQAALRERLVRNSTLAVFARGYKFEERIRIGDVARRGSTFEKILADVFEAYVAAVVLSSDDGFAVAEAWLTDLWADILLDGDAAPRQADENYKEALAKKIGDRAVKLEYERLSWGKDGSQEQEWGVLFTGDGYVRKLLGKGVGVGKKEAGMFAAKDALESNQVLVAELEEIRRIRMETFKKERVEREKQKEGDGVGHLKES